MTIWQIICDRQTSTNNEGVFIWENSPNTPKIEFGFTTESQSLQILVLVMLDMCYCATSVKN